MPFGYNGRILRVDLTTGALEEICPPEKVYRKFLGGSALGMYYLLQEMPAGVEAFSPENVLILMLSVITGAPISGQSRIAAVAKSPLAIGIGDSQAGGFFPAELKFAGYDGIIIKGRSAKPVYLWVNDGKAELRDASHLWGKVTGEAEDILREELGDNKVEVLQIGPAGERLVRFAAIMNMCSRALGRTGLGAVMGAKNLKAIAVRGKGKVQIADPQTVAELHRKGTREIADDAGMSMLQKYGTAGVVGGQQASGGLPSFNYNAGSIDHYETLTGEHLAETLLKENDTCFGCSIRCKRVVEKEDSKFPVHEKYGGPEYETIACLGSYCGVTDLQAVSRANEICAMFGMDTISCGATIAFAMECFENGLLTLEDTGGIELRMGNAEALVQMTEMIGKRQGLGDLLAEGSMRAAQKIGKGAEQFLITVKGTELPAHMPQVKRSLGVVYASNPFGADHMSSEHDPSYTPGNSKALRRLAEVGLHDPQDPLALTTEKVRFAYITQCLYSLLDSAGVCQFVYGPSWQLYSQTELVQLINAVTGWNLSLVEALQVGERRLNMLRAFNMREGIDRSADRLPRKLFKELAGNGPSRGLKLDEQELQSALTKFYRIAGWDEQTGNPTRGKLESLGLEWVADLVEAK